MATAFNGTIITALAQRLNEPSWLTQLRQQQWAKHQALPWPHASDDIWRRTDVSLLDPQRGFTPTNLGLLQAITLTDAQFSRFTQPLGDEALWVRANGTGLSEAKIDGVRLEELSLAARREEAILRPLIEADGLTDAEQKLASLNLAFHHDDLSLDVPPGYTIARPVRLVRLWAAAAQQALFPLTIIRVGAGSRLTLIDEYVSSTGAGAPHLINGRVELVLAPDAQVHYVRLQRLGSGAREFWLQRATLGRGATFTAANINLGAALSKAHIVTKLNGAQSSAKLYGFVFGHQAQHVDQHTLQDHQAPHTFSNLEFKAALQDGSRMVYTGLIRIAKAAQQTDAYQSNHNLLLGQTARAETIPMLEILADDVKCKHGASAGPIDEEQTFYLMSRGVPRSIAQRLLVMGFVEPIIQQVPFEPLQVRLREEIEGSLGA